jgi:hypothetical protein
MAVPAPVRPITFLRETDWHSGQVETKGNVMGHFNRITSASRILMAVGAFVATPAAAASYDGSWNVRIASSRVSCGDGTSVSLAIANGQVAGSGMVNASGRVAPAGAISVSLKSGLKHAVGSGRLTETSGSGTWHGDLCSGTWTAQRI